MKYLKIFVWGNNMVIKDLELTNFRNYDKLKLNFSDGLNIIYGNNAEGKTNILESIYVLAITKSHRVNIDKLLICNHMDFSKIKGSVVASEKTKKMEILINQKGKRVKINDVVIKKISNYISNFKVIMFFPNDLELIKGSPSYRRKFLNIEIGQIDNKYLSSLNEYNVLIKSRNEYIKNKELKSIDLNYISILNEQIAKKGSEMYIKRRLFVERINESIFKIYKSIFEYGELVINYNTNIDIENLSKSEIEKKYKDKLDSGLKKDLFLGMTYFGPHRDDLTFYLNNKEVKEQASQGQQRTIVICIKLAEISIIKESTDEYPVLLLDDIFSELDEKKKNNIIKFLGKNTQTFITTTDLFSLKDNLINSARIFNIKNGKVIEKQQ